MLSLALATLGMATVWEAGSFLGRSAKARVGSPPVDLGAQNVSFSSGSGALIKGWYCPGAPGHGGVVLMHGVHGNRLAMVDRARLLRQYGYGVLLFDFQGHGESGGEQITFGWRESMDARAALEFMKDRCPGEKIGVVGASLGGAAAVLADPPLEVEAIVLEMVYPNIEAAISDRLRICFGPLGPLLTPLLSYQITPRFGISSSWLWPEAAVARLRTPKLFLCGAQDRHTTLAESKQMFEKAALPKELIVFPEANHQDLQAANPVVYNKSVLEFLERNLTDKRSVAGTHFDQTTGRTQEH